MCSLPHRTPGLHESLQPCSRAARKWKENEEMKRKRRGNGERMRKWRKNFLILSLYPPSLSISYIKIGHILSQNVKYGIFVANVTKTEHTRYEEIILGRILCEEAPQVVSACVRETWIRDSQWICQKVKCLKFKKYNKNILGFAKGELDISCARFWDKWHESSSYLGKILPIKQQ